MSNRGSAAPAVLFSVATIALLAAIATGCALLSPASPTTTVVDANGQQVTLDWAEYPAGASVPADQVLAAPRAEQVEAVGNQVLRELQTAVDAHAPALDWERAGDGEVFDSEENGYGGQSLHRVLNSAELSTAELPDDWPALAAAIDAELALHGYGPVAWDFDREPYPHETRAERDADVRSTNGSLDPAQMWQWMGSAENGSMWVSIMLWDVDRGVGASPRVARDDPQLLSCMVGGTVIAAVDEQAYRDGIAPFEGLALPEATHS